MSLMDVNPVLEFVLKIADRSVSCAARNDGLASVRSSFLSLVSNMPYFFLEWGMLLESFSRI